MIDFTRVKVTHATYEELATKLNGAVDSFENPNTAQLTGEFNIVHLEKFIGKIIDLSGYANDGPSFPKRISMRLTAVVPGALTFGSSASSTQRG